MLNDRASPKRFASLKKTNRKLEDANIDFNIDLNTKQLQKTSPNHAKTNTI